MFASYNFTHFKIYGTANDIEMKFFRPPSGFVLVALTLPTSFGMSFYG